MVKFIPETKIVMMNKEFYIVQDSGEQVVGKIIEFKRKIMQPVGEKYPEGKEELLRREQDGFIYAHRDCIRLCYHRSEYHNG